MINDTKTYMNASMITPGQSVVPKSVPHPWENNLTYGSAFTPDSFETETPKINQTSTAFSGTGNINFQSTPTEEVVVNKTFSQITDTTSPITSPKSDTANLSQPKKISSDPASDNQFWANLEKNLKAVASNTDFITTGVKTSKDSAINAGKDIYKEVSTMVTKDILGVTDQAKPKTKEEEEKKKKLHEFFARHVESRKTTLIQEQQKVMAVFQQREDARFELAGVSEEQLAHSAGHQKNYQVEKNSYLRSFLFFKKAAKKKEEESHKESPFAASSKRSVGVDGKLRQDLANEGGILSTTGGVGAG